MSSITGFKVGDKVKCVDITKLNHLSAQLREDKEYTISDVLGPRIQLANYPTFYYFSTRFILASSVMSPSIPVVPAMPSHSYSIGDVLICLKHKPYSSPVTQGQLVKVVSAYHTVTGETFTYTIDRDTSGIHYGSLVDVTAFKLVHSASNPNAGMFASGHKEPYVAISSIPSAVLPKKCSCEFRDLLMSGCKCGGV